VTYAIGWRTTDFPPRSLKPSRLPLKELWKVLPASSREIALQSLSGLVAKRLQETQKQPKEVRHEDD
jgi:hypothetical protein